jgi:hypothetical protein
VRQILATGRRRGRRAVSMTTAVVIAVGAFQCVTVWVPAHAETTATVKAKTQRTNAPNLGSQEGFYSVGDQLTLVCHAKGERVKGFFSFNIPGGWDDLWYRTSDGHYVADVDIETHTLNPLGLECGEQVPANQPPAAAGTKADDAVRKANSVVGTDKFGPEGCGLFVAWAYGAGGLGVNTAKEFRDKLAGEGRIHMDRNFPRGALIFSDNSLDGGAGHVDIAQGDGTFVSGGVLSSYKGLAGTGHNVQVMDTYDPTPGATFLGWAEAPW